MAYVSMLPHNVTVRDTEPINESATVTAVSIICISHAHFFLISVFWFRKIDFRKTCGFTKRTNAGTNTRTKARKAGSTRIQEVFAEKYRGITIDALPKF